MFINHSAHTIEITKAESKAAGIVGSEMDRTLGEQVSRFPAYTVVVVKAKKTRDYLDRINFEFMEAYMKAKGDKENLQKFYLKKGCDNNGVEIEYLHKEDFFSIKSWFLEEYKEIKEYADEIKATKDQKAAARNAEKVSKREEEMKKFIAYRNAMDNQVA